MAYPILTEEVVKSIKEDLWNGKAQKEIAEEKGVAQPTISRIVSGSQWSGVEWPNGSSGALSSTRRLELHQQRRSANKAKAAISLVRETRPDISAAALAAALTSLADEADDRDLASVKTGGTREAVKRKDEVPKLEQPDFSEEVWEALKERAPRNIFLRSAKDQKQKVAVMTVLSNLPESQWGEESTGKLIKRVKEQLKHGS